MDFTKITENLEAAGYTVVSFATKEEACEYLGKEIEGKTVGIGGSATVEEMGLYDVLTKNNTVYWHWKPTEECPANAQRKQATLAQVYISSVNGIAETGEIINIDGNGNRVASIIYGHEKVYLVVGKNKIAEDFDGAMYRAQNIAAPKNAQRMGMKTPCAKDADKCYNCKGKARLCKALTVLYCKPNSQPIEVVLIDEELGY